MNNSLKTVISGFVLIFSGYLHAEPFIGIGGFAHRLYYDEGSDAIYGGYVRAGFALNESFEFGVEQNNTLAPYRDDLNELDFDIRFVYMQYNVVAHDVFKIYFMVGKSNVTMSGNRVSGIASNRVEVSFEDSAIAYDAGIRLPVPGTSINDYLSFEQTFYYDDDFGGETEDVLLKPFSFNYVIYF